MSYILLEEKLFEADNLIRENRINDAINLLYDILNEEPTFGKAHNHLGYIYETKLKDYKKADEHYSIALKLSPDYPAIYYNYAILLSNEQRFEQLEQLLNQALTLSNINKSSIYNEFGIMYEIKGEYDKAIDAFKKAIAFCLDNKNMDIYKSSIERCKTKKEIL